MSKRKSSKNTGVNISEASQPLGVTIGEVNNTGGVNVFGGTVNYSYQPTRKEKLEARLQQLDRDQFKNDRLKSFANGSRKLELAEVKTLIQQQFDQPTGGYVVISGQAGQGKTSLIAKLIDQYYQDSAYHFIPFNPTLEHQVVLLHRLLAALALKYSYVSDLWTDTTVRSSLAGTLSDTLLQISEQGDSEVIFIDGLDQIKPDVAASQRDLDFLPLELPKGIVIVVGTRPDDTLQPLSVRCPQKPYKLSALSKEDFRLVLKQRGTSITDEQLEELHTAVKGNAFDLDFAAQELEKLKGAAEVAELLERIRKTPKNALFDQAIERLRTNETEWMIRLKPILGYLLTAVKTESLSTNQIKDITGLSSDEVKRAIQKLRGLLGVADRGGVETYYLYHLRLIDYLQDEQEGVFDREEIKEQHARLARWCERDGAAIWQITKPGVRQERWQYARQHYIAHLFWAEDWNRLWEVLDEGEYGRNKIRHYDPSTHAYALDLELGQRAAASEQASYEESLALLPNLWRYTLLKCSLASRADKYTDDTFELMYKLGREAETLGLVELLTDSVKQARVLGKLAALMELNPICQSQSKTMLLRAYKLLEKVENSQKQMETLQILVTVSNMRDEAIYQQALATANSVEEDLRRAIALSAIAATLGQADLVEQAITIFNQAIIIANSIDFYFTRGVALRAIAAALAKAGLINQAIAIANSIEDREKKAYALRDIATALARNGSFDQALSIANSIKYYDSCLADALRDIAIVLAKSGSFDQALTIANSVKIDDSRIYALPAIALALIKAGQAKQATTIFNQAITLANSIKYDGRRAYVLSDIVVALTQAGQVEQATTIFNQAITLANSSEFEESRTYALPAIATALKLAGSFDQALIIANSIKNEESRNHTLRAIAAALVKAGQIKQAATIFDQTLNIANSIEDDDTRAYALRAISAALAKAGLIDRAIAIANSIKRNDSRTNALRDIVAALAKNGSFDQALTIANSIKRNDSRHAYALRDIATALAKNGSFDQALTITNSIRDEDSHVYALSSIAAALTQAGQVEQATTIFDQAFTIASSIEHGGKRVYALRSIAAALTQAGLFDQPLTITNPIKREDSRTYALRAIATALTQAGMKERVMRLIHAEWLQVANREGAIIYMRLAGILIAAKADVAMELVAGFKWVDNFLKRM